MLRHSDELDNLDKCKRDAMLQSHSLLDRSSADHSQKFVNIGAVGRCLLSSPVSAQCNLCRNLQMDDGFGMSEVKLLIFQSSIYSFFCQQFKTMDYANEIGELKEVLA